MKLSSSFSSFRPNNRSRRFIFRHPTLLPLLLALAMNVAMTTARSGAKGPKQIESATNRVRSSLSVNPAVQPLMAGAVYTVNSLNDPGSGTCDVAECTLREAMAAATSGTDTIDITVTGTINLASELPQFTASVTINGPGANLLTVQRNTAVGTPAFRIFMIASGAGPVNLNGMTISNGRPGSGIPGGGILNNAGATLSLTNVTISGNRTGEGFSPPFGPGGGSGSGGGVSNFGTLTIVNSTISGNFTGAGGEGSGPVPCMSFPSCGPGQIGGVGYPGGSSGGGGGVSNSGTLTIVNSTISSNFTGNGGRGGFGAGGGDGGDGGGILNNTGATLSLTNVTIRGNGVGAGGSGGRQGSGGGGGIYNSLATVTLMNTIIASNGSEPGGQTYDVSGNLNPASSFNLIGTGGSGGLTNGVNNNQVGVANPGLGPLANNGGPTMTVALLPNSPAIDAGSNAFITNPPFPGPPFTDQRGTGFSRIVSGTVDIGAFESHGFTVSATSGTPQSATITTVFAAPLIVTVGSGSGEPIGGAVVTFTAPSSGASGRFPGNATSVSITTDAGGVATSPTFTANGTGGSYNVAASIGAGLSTSTVNFELTNLKRIQTINFGVLANKTFGDQDFTVSATASSGLPVGFTASGQCTVTVNSVHLTGAGACTITASQAGDSNFNTAPSVSQAFNIAKSASNTGLSSSTNPSALGQAVTFTASVTSSVGAPTGTVQFKDNGTSMGAAAVLNDSGIATYTTSSLTAGTHAITADYSGDGNFDPSSGTLAGGQVVGTLIRFSSPIYSTTESSFAATITVERSGDVTSTVTVDYATPDDSAATHTILPCSTPGLVSARCDFTTAVGTLKFAPGETAKTFTVLISQDNYVEGPESLTLTLANVSSNALLATPSTATLTLVDDVTEPATNPMDDSANFVRQHYHDLLNREPDPTDLAGLNHWTNELGQNWPKQGDHDLKGQNVSGAFFLSLEFQQSGYYVYRTYKAGFGDVNPPTVPVPVRYLEFVRDTQEVQAGVIVGQDGWQGQLAANKQAYALEFVKRSEFLLRYPALTSATAFVNLLDANTGNVLTSSERSTLISQLSVSPADTARRADVLMQVAENAVLKQQEFNRAFVLLQYFGYLRRNPDAAPEAGLNFDGYNFWLNKLNQFNGDFLQAEMVKAFLSSLEYRQRFGP